MGIKIVIGEVRFSYAHVWEPWSNNGKEAKYSVSLLIPKSNEKMLNQIRLAIKQAKQQGVSKWGGKIPSDCMIPIRDGDKNRPDDAVYVGPYFMNANCKTPPGIIDRNRQPIIDTTEFYSGCYGYASITFYAYNRNGNKGIACGLNHIMKTRDGESLGGRARAEDDFANIVLDDDFTPVNDDDEDLPF